MTNPSPRSMPVIPAVEAPVHILGLQGASVVIVDDQETARIALDQMIKASIGIRPSLFAGGVEALAWLESTTDPRCAVSDARDEQAQLTAELRHSRRLQHVP